MDRRILKTKRLIQKAYFDLLKEKKGGRITISEIARRADIDRKTFYLHYDSVEDMNHKYCREKIRDFMDVITRADLSKNELPIVQFILLLNRLASLDKAFFKLVVIDQNADYFFQIAREELAIETVRRYKHLFPQIPEEKLKDYMGLYIAGILSVYVEWARTDCDISVNVLASMINSAVMGALLSNQNFEETFQPKK